MGSAKSLIVTYLASAVVLGCAVLPVNAQRPAATPTGPHGEGGKISHFNGDDYISYTYIEAPGRAGVPIVLKVFRPRLDPPDGLPKPRPPQGDSGSWVFIGEGVQAPYSALMNLDASGIVTWTFMPAATLEKYRPAASTPGGTAPGARQDSGAAAEPAKTLDPNLPKQGGDFAAAPGSSDDINLVQFSYDGTSNTPSVIFHGSGVSAMTYLGFNDKGSWLTFDNQLYTLKGKTVRKLNMELAQVPKGLQNPSPIYLELRQMLSSGITYDPNLPPTGGDIFTGVREVRGAVSRIVFYYTEPKDTTHPVINFFFGPLPTAMAYLGYNEEGSWLVDQGNVYTLKGHTVTDKHISFGYGKGEAAGLPRNLKNPSQVYTTAIELENGNGTAAVSHSPAGPAASNSAFAALGRQASVALLGKSAVEQPRKAAPAPHAASSPAKPAATPKPGAAPLSVEGSDARIARQPGETTVNYVDLHGKMHTWKVPGAITLTFKGAHGNLHSYRIVRQGFVGMSPQVLRQSESANTGDWLYVAADGKSGILFHIYFLVPIMGGERTEMLDAYAPGGVEDDRYMMAGSTPISGARLGAFTGYGGPY